MVNDPKGLSAFFDNGLDWIPTSQGDLDALKQSGVNYVSNYDEGKRFQDAKNFLMALGYTYDQTVARLAFQTPLPTAPNYDQSLKTMPTGAFTESSGTPEEILSFIVQNASTPVSDVASSGAQAQTLVSNLLKNAPAVVNPANALVAAQATRNESVAQATVAQIQTQKATTAIPLVGAAGLLALFL